MFLATHRHHYASNTKSSASRRAVVDGYVANHRLVRWVYHIVRVRAQANIDICELHASLIGLREESTVGCSRNNEGIRRSFVPIDMAIDLPHVGRDQQAVGEVVNVRHDLQGTFSDKLTCTNTPSVRRRWGNQLYYRMRRYRMSRS